ncbi:UNVERIFIED_CONTAM: hypothetical protein GTU68_049559 [Idotea baltica]|nr:hypothetical protein [Idotea baltica]
MIQKSSILNQVEHLQNFQLLQMKVIKMRKVRR